MEIDFAWYDLWPLICQNIDENDPISLLVVVSLSRTEYIRVLPQLEKVKSELIGISIFMAIGPKVKKLSWFTPVASFLSRYPLTDLTDQLYKFCSATNAFTVFHWSNVLSLVNLAIKEADELHGFDYIKLRRPAPSTPLSLILVPSPTSPDRLIKLQHHPDLIIMKTYWSKRGRALVTYFPNRRPKQKTCFRDVFSTNRASLNLDECFLYSPLTKRQTRRRHYLNFHSERHMLIVRERLVI